MNMCRRNRLGTALLALAPLAVVPLVITKPPLASYASKTGRAASTGQTDIGRTSKTGLVGRPRGGPSRHAVEASANPIVTENQKPGTTAWALSSNPSTNIEGYASEISVAPGQILHMHISARSTARYRVQIYRLGWYRGKGGRLIACLPSCLGDKRGRQYRVPSPDPITGEVDARWPITDTIRVASQWTSGYFVAKLVLTSGRYARQASYISFIVRAAPSRRSAILVQASVNTWEAYNAWGGKSLYPFNSTNGVAATMVSFNRPFDVLGTGGQTWSAWEIHFLRFLERTGYDVSYQTDVDTDRTPASLLGHKLDIVSGHDEYWSKAMRDAWDAARDRGVNLAFIGADIGYWQARYADSDRTLIEYRTASADPDTDPAQKTVPFQKLNPPRPECQLLGIEYFFGTSEQTGTYDYTVTPSAGTNPWFAHTPLHPGDVLRGAVGYEWDGIASGCSVPALTSLLRWQGPRGSTADTVTYRAPSGARVFSDGTLNLTWMLDDLFHPGYANAGAQSFMRNVLDDLSGRRR